MLLPNVRNLAIRSVKSPLQGRHHDHEVVTHYQFLKEDVVTRRVVSANRRQIMGLICGKIGHSRVLCPREGRFWNPHCSDPKTRKLRELGGGSPMGNSATNYGAHLRKDTAFWRSSEQSLY